jgi:hypothetical protein
MSENNELVLKPISELLDMSFYIPAYQRGYRWTERQVTDLLNDVLEFCDKDNLSKNEFYCLQPIVIKAREEEWELVDGQQRLTTIFLILSFFNGRLSEEYRKKIFSLEYETRVDSKAYLNTLSEVDKEKNIDFFHIYESYQVIRDWFKTYVNRINDIESVFLNKVKVIWYEVKETIDPIDVFTRLNMGKIPLTNGELVKALYLRSSNFDQNEATLQQLKIAQEWDGIEKTLQADSFWYFISNDDPYSNRIEFILNLMADEVPTSEDVKRDPNYTFLVFNKIFANTDSVLNKEWLKVKKYFMTIEEWFNDRYLYHLIGFLINQEESISKIKEISDKCDSKYTFRNKLKDLIFNKLLNTNGKTINSFDEKELDVFIRKSLANWDYTNNAGRIRLALLLFNIASLVASPKSNMRFQFDSYKKDDWDIEHVRSIKSRQPDTPHAQKAWLENVLKYFTGESDDTAQRNASKSLLKQEKMFCKEALLLIEGTTFNSELFEELYDKLIMHFGDDKEQEVDNTLGNLTLLDASTNRSYKNSVFPIKRQRIIGLDKTGTFVPLCTKNLFLKYYSKQVNNMMVWTDKDRGDHFDAIVSVLVSFFLNDTEVL